MPLSLIGLRMIQENLLLVHRAALAAHHGNEEEARQRAFAALLRYGAQERQAPPEETLGPEAETERLAWEMVQGLRGKGWTSKAITEAVHAHFDAAIAEAPCKQR